MADQQTMPSEEIGAQHSDADSARRYLEERRWGGRIACPSCGATDVFARKGQRVGFYKCRTCSNEFTVRTGTVLERSHVPLHKWLHAIHILATTRDTVSAGQLANQIDLTEKTARSVLSRLLEACRSGTGQSVPGSEEGDSMNQKSSTGDPRPLTPMPASKILDSVLQYRRDPLQAIAGAPDKPLTIGDIEIPCYVLSDETRVLSQQGFLGAVGRAPKAKGGHGATITDNPPSFLAAQNLRPFVSDDLHQSTTPIPFQTQEGGRAFGYKAALLPQVCEVYLRARDADALRPSQRHIAERAEVLVRGLAAVGIVALVDEATGYQRVRQQRALASILEKFIAKELQPWTKTFPFEFYEQICRLRGWPNIYSIKRPSVIGKYTNDIVYERLAPGVLDELKRMNPTLPSGNRRYRHHQWFTRDVGHPKLRDHLVGVIAVMRVSSSWRGFQRNLQKAYPKLGEQLLLDLETGDNN